LSKKTKLLNLQKLRAMSARRLLASGLRLPRANPALSQSFLLDAAACDKIVRRAGIGYSRGGGDGGDGGRGSEPGRSGDAQQELGRRHVGTSDRGCSPQDRANGRRRRPLVLEVGPGPGELTRALLARGADVVAVEIDPRFVPVLQSRFGACDGSRADGLDEGIEPKKLHADSRGAGDDTAAPDARGELRVQSHAGGDDDGGGARMQLVLGDALRENAGALLARVADPARHDAVWVAGNLPFHIASRLLAQWAEDVARGTGWAAVPGVPAGGAVAMFQREVAVGIRACPGTEGRSRLSVLCDTYFHRERIAGFSGAAFTPRVAVDAEVEFFLLFVCRWFFVLKILMKKILTDDRNQKKKKKNQKKKKKKKKKKI
jgi:16S rRNA A1518/A1519 N6-dimethyltransferase RsmA/KsgA/DIM1 with predicted DNA glycosylase/AP lyase activity